MERQKIRKSRTVGDVVLPPEDSPPALPDVVSPLPALAAPSGEKPKLARKSTFHSPMMPAKLDVGKQLQEFKHHMEAKRPPQKVIAITKEIANDSPHFDELSRKLDGLAREIHVTQKMILKLNEHFTSYSKHVSGQGGGYDSEAWKQVLMPETDKRFDKVRESLTKGRESFSKHLESLASLSKSRESFTRGRDVGRNFSITEIPQIPRSSSPKGESDSPRGDKSPPRGGESPRGAGKGRIAEGAEPFQSEEDSSRDDESSDIEESKRPRLQPRKSLTVGTVGTTNSWRTWTSKNVRRSTILSSITGRISRRWREGVSERMSGIVPISSYVQNESACSLDLGSSSRVARIVSQSEKRETFAFRAYHFLDNPDSSWSARLYDCLEPYFFFLAIVFSLLQTLPDTSSVKLPELACKTVDFCIDSLVMIDLLIRYAVSPFRGLAYLKKWLNIVDVLAAVPLVARLLFVLIAPEAYNEPTLFCLVAITRLLKMMRRFQKIQLLIGAFELALEALPVLAYVLALITLTFSVAMYLVEPRDNFDTLPTSIYFTLVTVTSLGYGDYTPVTPEGATIASILTICSAGYMAMPLGIIGSAFTSVWQDRDRILLMKKTRQAMSMWGFTANDIPMLFAFFDSQHRGTLSIHDFTQMIIAMRIGLSDKRVRELFRSFDKNGSGRVDDKEFVRQIFPQEFFEVYSISEADHSNVSSQPSTGSGQEPNKRTTLQIPEASCRQSLHVPSANAETA